MLTSTPLQAAFKQPTNLHLGAPNFSTKPGKVVTLVGHCGSGKSTVVQAILANTDLVSLKRVAVLGTHGGT
jgi:ABC-type bacteriocin/lantibiotic exporter with double-glycine peptidase domain